MSSKFKQAALATAAVLTVPLAVSFGAGAAGAASTTTTVGQADIANACNAGTMFCTDPSGTGGTATVAGAAGNGYLDISTPTGSDKVQVFDNGFNGKPLSAITDLTYSSLVTHEGSNADQAPTIQIAINPNKTDSNGKNVTFATLVWEPVYTDTKSVPGTQENFHPTANPSGTGGWWTSKNDANVGQTGPLGFNQYTASFADVQAALPNATIYQVGLGAGSGNAGLEAQVGQLGINDTNFRFTEPAPAGGGGGGTTSVAPVFTADTPPTGTTVGDAYGPYTFKATGTPAPTFAVSSGTLPAGLALDSATGVLSGTPTTAGTSTFTVTASNGVDPAAVSPSFTITVGKRFTDVPASNVFSADIDQLAREGIVKGFPDNTFHPVASVTRGEFAAFTGRLLGLTTSTGTCATGQSTFSDVPDSSPFCQAINALAKANVVRGNTNGTFKPSATINRQEIAAFLERADSYLRNGRTATGTTDATACTSQPFTDVPTSNQFCGDIAFLKASGISLGDSDGTYKPAADALREAVAGFLVRLEKYDAAPLAK